MDKNAIEARRAYKREWYRKNREHVKEYNERYWQKKADHAAEAARQAAQGE